MSGTPIKFNFHPYKFDEKEHVIEKSENGMKRRFLRGIASGPKWDGHGERMTQKAIQSFSNQANTGDILLYADLHGIRFTDDIGTLANHEILPNGDWFNEYRLYDQSDDVGAATVETVNKLWKQVNGLSPYTQPRQKGFSVEGTIPEGGLIAYKEDAAGNVAERVIDDVLLDGVIVVPRPAYQDSIAHAVYKALSVQPEWVTKKVVEKAFNDNDEYASYYYGRYQLEDSLYKAIDSIMTDKSPEKYQRMDLVFSVFKSNMMNLIKGHEVEFNSGSSIADKGLAVCKQELFTDLRSTLVRITKMLDKTGASEVEK